MGKLIEVAKTGDIETGDGIMVEVEDKSIAIFNLDGEFFAIDNTCTHRGGPLSQGDIDGDVVTCPWHGAEFNVKSGDVVSSPAPKGVSTYRVEVEGDTIKIEI
ncbi:MAG: non-heme iron oxygenase ferredoxin subunit [Candidatus Dadabacteria bacterium]|nr:non-heme iron oxygenase ferredoxin subunit [Candidatus Dadabacteria bacterium]